MARPSLIRAGTFLCFPQLPAIDATVLRLPVFRIPFILPGGCQPTARLPFLPPTLVWCSDYLPSLADHPAPAAHSERWLARAVSDLLPNECS